jgi:hypothetical protein
MVKVSFYDLLIRPIEWMFPLNTYYSHMQLEISMSFPKTTKMVNLMINITVAFYTTPDLHQ